MIKTAESISGLTIHLEQTTNGADGHVDRMANSILGVDKYPFRAPNEKRIILKIKPEKIYSQFKLRL